ncbi:MAG: hypothetical protein M1820_005570 [Bogoriella megaspora]|nr:MAG: hypothetical protein M1820_005570 [Bogoriella megaspora]
MAESSRTTTTTPIVASDFEWNVLVEKGAKLLSHMEQGTLREDGESKLKYDKLSDEAWAAALSKVHWIQEDRNEDRNGLVYPFLRGNKPRVHLANVLKSLKVSDQDKKEGGENNYQYLRINCETFYNDESERKLVRKDNHHGQLENSFNPKDGVIICHRNYKPKGKAYDGASKGMRKLTEYKLVQWSDLIFIQWEHWAEQAKRNARDLRYVFRSRISNDHTLKVIRRAIKVNPSTPVSANQPPGDFSAWLNKWPGSTFGTDSDEGKALLATPNVKGIARGMIARPTTYRNKVIDKIQVFMDEPIPSAEEKPAVCMLIHITDKKPEPKAPEPSQQKVEVAGKNSAKSKAKKGLKSVKENLKKGTEAACKGQSN